MFLRLRPLSAAVLLSQSARPLYGVSPRLWGGPFPAPGAWCGPGLRQRRNECVRAAQVRDPGASLVRLVEVEPPDPRVDEVVRSLHLGGDECLELPHGDVGGRSVRQGDHAKSLFGLTSWRCLRAAATSPHGGVLAWMS